MSIVVISNLSKPVSFITTFAAFDLLDEEACETLADESGKAGDAVAREGSDAQESAGKNEKLHAAMEKIGQVAGGVMRAGLEAAGAAMAALGTAAAEGIAKGYEFAQSAGKYADDVATLSTQTGISTQKLQEWSYNSNLIDTSVDTITGSMTKMLNNMRNASQGSATAQRAFKDLGVSFADDVTGQLRDSEDVFWDAIDALGKIDNEAERDAAAMALFGKSAKELNPLIEAGSKAWQEMGKEAQAMGTVFSDENLAKMGAFDDSMQRFSATGTALKNSIGLVMIPAFQPLVNAATQSMGKVAKALQEGVTPEELPGLLNELLDTMTEAVGQVGELIEEALPIAGAALTRVAGALAAQLPGLVNVLLPSAMELMQTMVSTIADNTGPLTNLAVTLVKSLGGFLVDNLPMLGQAALQLVTGLLDGLIDALPERIPAGIQMMAQLAKSLIEALQAARDRQRHLGGTGGHGLGGAGQRDPGQPDRRTWQPGHKADRTAGRGGEAGGRGGLHQHWQRHQERRGEGHRRGRQLFERRLCSGQGADRRNRLGRPGRKCGQGRSGPGEPDRGGAGRRL